MVAKVDEKAVVRGGFIQIAFVRWLRQHIARTFVW
jgi:hypothetical protein